MQIKFTALNIIFILEIKGAARGAAGEGSRCLQLLAIFGAMSSIFDDFRRNMRNVHDFQMKIWLSHPVNLKNWLRHCSKWWQISFQLTVNRWPINSFRINKLQPNLFATELYICYPKYTLFLSSLFLLSVILLSSNSTENKYLNKFYHFGWMVVDIASIETQM